MQKDVDYKKLKIRGGDNTDYDFSDYNTFKELFRNLYYKKITIDEVERKQDKFNEIIGVLEDYTLRADKYIGARNKLSNNAKKILGEERKNCCRFKNGIFPFDYDEVYEEQTRYEKKEEKEEEEMNNIRNKNDLIDYEKLMG